MGHAQIERFACDDWRGEIVARYRPPDLAAEVRRLTDPAAAVETIHWGRNYLYRTPLETPGGPLDVVVKQFRNQDLGARLRRRWGAGKAERSWRMALAFEAAGVPTAPAVMLIESTRPDGPSFFVTRHLGDVVEARYLFRAVNAGREREEFPDIDCERFLAAVGAMLRRMHEAGFFHRDLSIGNILLMTGGAGDPSERLAVIDLNRARRRRRLGPSARTRDLCRLAIFRPEHQRLFLRAYWGPSPGLLRTALYRLYHHGFLSKIEGKKKLRAATRRWRGALAPRRAYAHIPPPPEEASARDKIVWDHLSDQPHQHAGRWEKLGVRLADAGSHLRQTATLIAALPRIRRAYRRLRRELYRRPVPWDGVGVCVRPYPEAPEELLAALEELGIRRVLVRLHPWADDDDAEETLARELWERGYELAFSLPQNRDLVRDPARWRQRIEELATAFVPYGRHFQIGQAINRSKWGIWRTGEYVTLARTAAEILRRYPGVEILGPSVIDFELHTTAGVLNRRDFGLRFDAVSSLLYVDRRGAPENPQLGFNTVDKVVLLRAIAETARAAEARSWITEVNWPLWEGPHAPAGRKVAVDESTQADYLVRYYLLALATGMVERVYWWQLIARGYGLIAPREEGGLRRRASFHALATLHRQLEGSHFIRPLDSAEGTCLYLFRHRDGSETVAGWSTAGERRARLPRAAVETVGRDGERLAASGPEAVLTPSVHYFRLQNDP